MELVSAVITTHKREPEVVERALKSILAQTYKNIEVFVVDDSPADYELRTKVEQMVKSYGGVTYIPHETCQGACAARNTGLNASKGKYIAFLDDDDEWLPEKIEKQLTGFTNDNIALVYCLNEVYDQTTNTTENRDVAVHTGMIFDELIKENFIGSTSFPLLRVDYLKEIGGFDPLMQSAQDYDVWLRLAQKYEVNFVNEILIRYYFHASEQITKNPKRRIAGLERLNGKYEEYLKKNRKIYWKRWIVMTPIYSRDGQFGKAISIWFKAAFKRPLKIKTNLVYLYSVIINRKRK